MKTKSSTHAATRIIITKGSIITMSITTTKGSIITTRMGIITTTITMTRDNAEPS